MEWSKTVVTGARDVYHRVSTEKGGPPQQKALTLEIATVREWLVNSGALIRWCRRKHYDERFDEGSQRVKRTLGSSTAERRMERTQRRYVGSYETDDSIETYAQDET